MDNITIRELERLIAVREASITRKREVLKEKIESISAFQSEITLEAVEVENLKQQIAAIQKEKDWALLALSNKEVEA